VEAVVVLPVFIIIFVSVFYIRSQVLSRQAAESKARTCAWAYSMKNCNEIPPGCEGVLQVVSGAGRVDDKIEGALSSATGGLVGPVIAKVLEPALKAAFGRALDARTQKSYERPTLYGGGTATTSGSYHLACNLTPETPLDVAKDAWNALSKF
jgi:hypothetical protein